MHVVCSSDEYTIHKLAADLWLLTPEHDESLAVRLPLSQVESLVLQQNNNLSLDFIFSCWHHGVPILFLDINGNPLAQTISTKQHGKASLWRRQLSFVRTQLALELATEWVYKKQKGQAALLATADHIMAPELLRAAEQNREAALNGFTESTLGLSEAQEARRYWTAYGSLTHIKKYWAGRQRRPADNIINAALNYGYGVLYGLVYSQVIRQGLHPGLGIIHSEAKGQDAMVYDLVEPLRPLVEAVVLQLSITNQLPDTDFHAVNGYLVGKCKGVLVAALFERLHHTDAASAKTPYQLWQEDLLVLTQAVRKQPRN